MIDDYKKQQAIEKAAKIYKEIAEDDKRLSDDFLSICSEPMSKYKAPRKTNERTEERKNIFP